MSRKRPSFQRPLGGRSYRKLFVIAAEGEKTEPEYFDIVKGFNPEISVKYAKKPSGSDPLQVLKRMKNYLKKERSIPPYEAWLVVDKDQWLEEQLHELRDWARQEDNYGFVLSNPKFEYWLLLHFEAGTKVKSPENLENLLKKHLPDYDKGIAARKFIRERIETAICRAKKRDYPPCADWPRELYVTTVYRLVEKMLAPQNT